MKEVNVHINAKALTMAVVIAIVLVFAACGNPVANNAGENPGDGYTPHLDYYSAAIPNADEEAQQFLYVLEQYKWFQDSGYTHVTIPDHPVLNPLKAKVLRGEYLTSTEKTQVISSFKADLYNQEDYQQAITAVRNAAVTADRQVDGLRKYETAWGFFIPKSYKVQLTVYGPGGQYNPSTGLIILKVPENGQFDRDPLSTILHETIHIGIEEKIIQKYMVIQSDKERLVDHFVKNHFSTLLPNYQLQGFYAPSIDKLFDVPNKIDVLENLPKKMEAILTGMMEEGIEKAITAATNATATRFEGYWINTVSSSTGYAFKGNGFAENRMGTFPADGIGTFTYTATKITFTAGGKSWTQPYELKTENGSLLVLEWVQDHSYGWFEKAKTYD